jgi:hypothetical protein
MEEVA